MSAPPEAASVPNGSLREQIFALDALVHNEAKRLATLVRPRLEGRKKTSQKLSEDSTVLATVLLDHETRLKQLVMANWFVQNYRICDGNFQAQNDKKRKAIGDHGLLPEGPRATLKVEEEVLGARRLARRRPVPIIRLPDRRGPPPDVVEVFYQDRLAGAQRLLKCPTELPAAPRPSGACLSRPAVKKKRTDLLEEVNRSLADHGMGCISKKEWIWTCWFLREFLGLDEGGDTGKPVWVVPTTEGCQQRDAMFMRTLKGYVDAYYQNK
jgi:hypothetical protein